MSSLVGALALSTPSEASSTTTSTTRAPAPPISITTTTEPPFVPPTIPEPDLSELRELLRGSIPESASPETPTRSPHRHASPSPAGTAGVEQWRALVEAHFRPEHVDRMLRVIECESRGLAGAVNPGSSRASGLWQHLPKYWSARSAAAGVPGADILDPTAGAIVAAWLLYDAPGAGWGHWTCKG